MLQVGSLVAAVEKGPVLCAHVRPVQGAKAHAGLMHLAPFLADLLALFLVQRRQKAVEIAVPGAIGALVAPVELHGAALHPAVGIAGDRKSTRLNSSHSQISY